MSTSGKACPVFPEMRDVVHGTAAANKAVILDGNSKIDALDITAPKLNGTSMTTTATAASTKAEVEMAADVSSFLAAYTATSPAGIPATVRVIELNHASTAIEKTIASMVPYAGQVVVVKDTSATGTAAHKVTITTGTWDGTNKVVTLNALNEYIAVQVDSAGNGTVLVNAGSVALS